MSKYLGVCCIILSQGIYLFLTLSACLLTLLYLSLSQLNSKFIWILLKLGSMSTSQECPLSNCSIAWNSILVGSLSRSQYSEGERNMLALTHSATLYWGTFIHWTLQTGSMHHPFIGVRPFYARGQLYCLQCKCRAWNIFNQTSIETVSLWKNAFDLLCVVSVMWLISSVETLMKISQR